VEERERDPSLVQASDVGDSYLRGRLLDFKCELLCPTLTRKGGNVGYIREVTHIPDALRFWMEIWCLNLLVVLDV
jgi:hypothetical protein